MTDATEAEGRLVLVATPIGNLGDLSRRAIEALGSADVIACEDTRRTGRLLQLAGVPSRAPLMVVNEHTERDRAADVLQHLERGERVVVVSDAGLPGISDPGERLVQAAVEAGHRVEVIPGASAGVTALVASGLPTHRFAFEGFLPRKGAERAARLGAVAAEQRTTVLYEAPHRLARTLDDLVAACGPGRRVALARELTKLHEEVWRGTLGEAVAWVASKEARGEFVVVLDAAPAVDVDDETVRSALGEARTAGLSTRDAVAEVVERLGVNRRRVYALALE